MNIERLIADPLFGQTVVVAGVVYFFLTRKGAGTSNTPAPVEKKPPARNAEAGSGSGSGFKWVLVGLVGAAFYFKSQGMDVGF